MENPELNEPTVEELIAKALAAEVIDQEFAEDLRDSTDFEEALGMFYTYVIEKGDDPEALLTEWGISEPTRPRAPFLRFINRLKQIFKR